MNVFIDSRSIQIPIYTPYISFGQVRLLISSRMMHVPKDDPMRS